MKTTDVMETAWRSVSRLVVMANTVMQMHMPIPLTMKTLRRPKRSIAKNGMKLHAHFHVSALAAKMRERSLPNLRFSSKMVDM